jgi:hypothetical protein
MKEKTPSEQSDGKGIEWAYRKIPLTEKTVKFLKQKIARQWKTHSEMFFQ